MKYQFTGNHVLETEVTIKISLKALKTYARNEIPFMTDGHIATINILTFFRNLQTNHLQYEELEIEH